MNDSAPEPVEKETAKTLAREAAFTETTEDGEPGRTLIHSFAVGSGFALGADWDLDEVLEFIDAADEVAWVDGPGALGHELAVRGDGRVRLFQVKRPRG